MKKFVTLLICLMLSGSMFAYDYSAPETDVAATIDGVMTTGEWDDAFTFNMSYPDILSETPAPWGAIPDGWTLPTATDLSADISMKWDADFIYICLQITDDNLSFINNSGSAGYSEAVQLCFNPDNFDGHYTAGATIIDFAVDTMDSAGPVFVGRVDAKYSDPLNVIMDGSIVTGGYVIEIALKNEAFGLTPEVADTIGMSFILSDVDSTVHETLMIDSGEGNWGTMTITSSWNTFRFVGADGCGAYGFASGDTNSDCIVDLTDFAEFAKSWMDCTDPTNEDCVEI